MKRWIEGSLPRSSDENEAIGPVAIGGVGGSGTRVVAEIIGGLGVDIGRDLNAASDNRLYTLLFKRPQWFRENWRDAEAIDLHLGLLERIYVGPWPLGVRHLSLLARAAREMSRHGHTAEHHDAGPVWSSKRLYRALVPRLRHRRPVHWGWKEPNTHLILDHLGRRYRNLRYIHVVRHGLDMAFSGNQQQVQNWSTLFGLPDDEAARTNPVVNAYRYWIRANERVLTLGHAIGPDRFLLLRLEELCGDPRRAVDTIARFIGVNADPVRLDRLAALPKMPGSVGRYRDQDTGIFSRGELSALERVGYRV